MTQTAMKERALARWFAPALVASFLFNVAALVFPFMHLKTGIMPTEVYTMFAGVCLLWDSGLYALAFLVVGFSVVFPFAKLASIVWVWRCGAGNPARAHKILDLVESLGKWSMLDIFLVGLMLALTSRQWLVSSRPDVGIVFFLLAVLLSMLCGSHLARFHGLSVKPVRQPLTGLVTLLSVAVLILLPVLQIHSFWLSDRDLSLLSAMTGLAGSGAWSLTLAVFAFLVLAPLVQGGAQLGALIARRRGGNFEAWELLSARAEHWAMLDVFTLALMIFLVEGRSMVPTQVQPGCWVLVVTVALQIGVRLLRR